MPDAHWHVSTPQPHWLYHWQWFALDLKMRNLYDDRHTVEMVQVCLLFMISHAPWPSSKRAFKSESDFVSSQEFTTVPVAVPVVVTVTSSWNKLSPSSKNNCKVEMIGGTSTSPDKVGDRSWQLVLILH